jgi:hypothetical protein
MQTKINLLYLPIQKVTHPDNQVITSIQKQISNMTCEHVGKEELKKGSIDEVLSAGAFQI